MDYLTDIQEDLANASTIDNGLKKGIEYRVPSGCIVELDALYAGDAVGGVTNLTSGTTKQPTEDDCCQACKSVVKPCNKTCLIPKTCFLFSQNALLRTAPAVNLHKVRCMKSLTMNQIQ